MTDDDAGTSLVLAEDRQRAIDLLTGLKEMEAADGAEINAAAVRRILLAEDEDEAFHELDTLNCEAIEGRPFEVASAQLLPSKYNGGKGAFIAADVTLLYTGEKAILTTSAARPAARIAWLQMHGKLPRQCVVTVVSEATAAGHKVYGLELVG
jgi:hypothetical protein